MSMHDALLTLFICLFAQGFSWIAWCFGVIFFLEYVTHLELRNVGMPKWLCVRPRPVWSEIKGIIAGFLALSFALGFNLLFTRPEFMLRTIHLEYLGEILNVVAFICILFECRRESLPRPVDFHFVQFVRYTLRRTARNRIFAGVTALLMTFGTWLYPLE